MKQLEWLSDGEFMVGGATFCCAHDYTLKTDARRCVLLKSRDVLEIYAGALAGAPPRNVLEFGIFQGGSPALFAAWLDLDKIVGVDICDPVEGFGEFCRTHEVGRKIRTHYRVSQTDKRRIDEIVRREFGDAALDMIIDDASHLYGATRSTFEIAFPHLKPGGLYVIEDWGWAHWPNCDLYPGRTPLSVLVMELIMLCASRPDIVTDVRVFPSLAFVRKAQDAPQMSELALDALYRKRGLEIVGARDVNLPGLARLFANRVYDQASGALRRAHRHVSRKNVGA